MRVRNAFSDTVSFRAPTLEHHIRILAGDKVSLELSPYDLTKGRITFRHIEGRPPMNPQARRR